MPEHINNDTTLISSGGHRWLWSERQIVRKSVGSAGVSGVAGMVLSLGGRAVRIGGWRGAAGALLKATGSSKSLADSALNALVTAIQSLCESGMEVMWEDDQGHSGARLQLVSYKPLQRSYSRSGSNWVAWEFYQLDAIENGGGF